MSDLLMGDFLSGWRKKSKLTQKELASTVGLHAQFISNIERNICPPPVHVIKAYVQQCKIPQSLVLEHLLEQRRQWVKENIFEFKPTKSARRR